MKLDDIELEETAGDVDLLRACSLVADQVLSIGVVNRVFKGRTALGIDRKTIAHMAIVLYDSGVITHGLYREIMMCAGYEWQGTVDTWDKGEDDAN